MTAAEAKKFDEIKRHWSQWEDHHREKISTNAFAPMASAEVTTQIKFLVGMIDRLEAELAEVKENLQLRLERDHAAEKKEAAKSR